MTKDEIEKLKAITFRIASKLDVKLKESEEIEEAIYEIVDYDELDELGFYVDVENLIRWTKEEEWVWKQANPEKSMVGDNYLNARMEHRIHLKSRILYHRDEDFWLEWEKENDSFVNDLNLKHIVKNCVMIAEEPELYAKRFDNHYQPLETFWEWRRGPQENLQTLPMVQPTYTIIFKGSTLGAFANKEAVYEMTDEERLEVL